MNCPNCGSNCTEFCGSMVQQRCSDCGTWWSPNTGEVLFVPERSRPVEVLELPNDEGDWRDGESKVIVSYRQWHDVKKCYEWIVVCGHREGRADGLNRALNFAEVPRGQYVRCVTPLVKPQAKDPDAEWIRNTLVHHYSYSDGARKMLRRIAARLESEGKHE